MDAQRIETAKRSAVIRLSGVVAQCVDSDDQLVRCCRDFELIVNDLVDETVRRCVMEAGRRVREP